LVYCPNPEAFSKMVVYKGSKKKEITLGKTVARP
jgi:hypothetical protein